MMLSSQTTTGMKRSTSMLFDMELEENTCSGGGGSCGFEAAGHHNHMGLSGSAEIAETSPASFNLRNVLKPWTPFEQKVHALVRVALEDFASFHQQEKKFGGGRRGGGERQCEGIGGGRKGRDSVNHVACYLTFSGLQTTLRTSLGGGQGGECLQNLRHSYVLCAEKPAAGGRGRVEEKTIIEPNFREQFAVARPSREYQTFYDSIPEFFVGSMHNLTRAVKLICSEISRSFEQGKLHVPAWRKRGSLISKWQPKRWNDRSVTLDSLREWWATDATFPAAEGNNERLVFSPGVEIGIGN